MPKTYCGINKTPKGQTIGTPAQCAAKNQIRRYGKEAVHEAVHGNVSSSRKIAKLRKKKAELNSKISKYRQQLEGSSKSVKQKALIRKWMNGAITKSNEIDKQIKETNTIKNVNNSSMKKAQPSQTPKPKPKQTAAQNQQKKMSVAERMKKLGVRKGRRR